MPLSVLGGTVVIVWTVECTRDAAGPALWYRDAVYGIVHGLVLNR